MTAKLVFSGRTAAGKTTHARLLGHELDVPVYSASSFLVQAASEGKPNRWKGRWSPEIDLQRLKTDALDDQVDAYMTNAVRSSDGGVFDGCFLPWLIRDPNTVYLWIESDLPSRVRKCIVSHLDEERMSEEAALGIVAAKDTVTEHRLKKVARATFEHDRVRFHIVVDNTTLIPRSTKECAEEGIEVFSKVVMETLQWCLGNVRRLKPDPHVLFARRL